MNQEEFINIVQKNSNNFNNISNKDNEYYLKDNIDIILKINFENKFTKNSFIEHTYVQKNSNSYHCDFNFFYKDNLIYTKYCIFVDNLIKPYFLPYPKKLNDNKIEIKTTLQQEKNGDIKYYQFSNKEILWYKHFSLNYSTADQYYASLELFKSKKNIIIE